MLPDHSYSTKEAMRTDRQSIVAELEKAGAHFRGNECLCPFHDDTRQSGGIYQDTMGVWRFKCQVPTCGVSGDYWDIRARNEGKTLGELFKESTPEEIKTIAGPPPTATKKPALQKAPRKSWPTIDMAAAVISDQIEARYSYTNPYSKAVELVVFRIQTGSGKTFRQVSTAPGGWSFQAPPKPWPIYNRTRIIDAEVIIVVEGEKCVHILDSYGLVATTSPCGAGKAGQADWSLLSGKTVVLWPDNDDAGRKHMQQVREALEKLDKPPEIKLVDPAKLELEPKEDVVDFIKIMEVAHLDRDRILSELKEVLGMSKPIGPAEAVGQRIEAAIDGSWSAIELPWYYLERLVHPFLPGCVALLVGSVGHGKSYLLLQFLAHFHREGYRVSCLQLEEDRTYHLSRVLAQEAGLPELVDPQWVKANQDLARSKYAESRPFLESFGQCVWASPDDQLTLDEVSDWVEARAADGCRLLAIDPITAAAGTDKPWIADSRFLNRIKKSATDSGASIVLVTHPTKAYKGPDVNQLAGGAAYSRFAQSIIWLLSHDQKTSRVKGPVGTGDVQHDRTMMIMKARNGKGGGLSLAFELDRETLRLRELGIIIKESK